METSAAARGQLTAPPGFTGVWRTDDAARAVYSEAAGISRIVPRAVAVASSPADVVALVQWAAASGTPLIARGSGSSMSGGAVGEGVILDLTRLRGLEITGDSCRAGPGVLGAEVDRAARAIARRFPVLPSSASFCTVGGMVATNAAGAHSLKFGSVRSWVRALDCVFADGSRATVRRGDAPPTVDALRRFATIASRPPSRDALPQVRKNSSGYAASPDPLDVLVGSEGTLAIIVGVELALATLPQATRSLLAAFPGLAEAAAGAAAARAAGAVACELLERSFIDLARRSGDVRAADLPEATDAVLLVELEGGSAADAEDRVRGLQREMTRAGAIRVRLARGPAEVASLWELRHAASPVLASLDPGLASMQFIEDGAVPPARLAEYIAGVRRALKNAGIRGVMFGHAGDAHVHVNPLVDLRDADWLARVNGLLEEVCGLTRELGGTMSGEHGDGRIRAPLLRRVQGDPAADWVTQVKDVFDPLRVLNPAVKEPLPGQRPIEGVKYDPSLPPLPAAARAVLDQVSVRRAYARSRLELLDGQAGAMSGNAPG